MPAQRDTIQTAGGRTAEELARRLSEAVGSGVNVAGNGSGPHQSNGNGAIRTPSAREVAIDVCSAILAETSAGTAEHSSDVVLITEAVGERMGVTGKDAEDLLAAARLHDIGKAWVPNKILEKPGPLSDEEWELMRQHTLVGQRILSPVPELDAVGLLVRHSHERWDGHGYPDRLIGPEIPLGSRIIFCADAFHAIRCDRPYRTGRAARKAVAEIKRCAGTQFDPTVADALEEVVREGSRRPRGARASRLFALLMCLVVGGAGTALARSDLLGEPTGPATPPSAPKPPPACGTAACPTVAGPVGGLAAVGGPGWVPGPRVLHPGLPGELHRGGLGGKKGAADPKGNHGKGEAAKQHHASKSHGKALGHSGEPHSRGESASSQSAGAPSPSSSGHSGGSGGGSSGSHHSSSGHHSSGGRGSSGSSRGHAGGSRGGTASPGSSGQPGGSGGSHGG